MKVNPWGLNYEPFIVGIGHRARHGKDTLARQLHAYFPMHSKVYSFSDSLKAHVRVLGLMGQEKDGPLLQTYGTEVYRRASEHFWVNQLIYRLNDDQMPLVIIPDMRFKNEKAFVQESGGVSVKVHRVYASGLPYVDPSRPANHPSEAELDNEPFDYTVTVPDGNLNELTGCSYRLAKLISERLNLRGEPAHDAQTGS